MAAVVGSGTIYTSTDTGVTWISRDSVRIWIGVCCSKDGTKMYATVNNGNMYMSVDTGVTWYPKLDNANRVGICCTNDGTGVMSVVSNSFIYTGSLIFATDPGHVLVGTSYGSGFTELLCINSNLWYITSPSRSPSAFSWQ